MPQLRVSLVDAVAPVLPAGKPCGVGGLTTEVVGGGGGFTAVVVGGGGGGFTDVDGGGGGGFTDVDGGGGVAVEQVAVGKNTPLTLPLAWAST